MNWRWEQVEKWLLDIHPRDEHLLGAEVGVKEGRFAKYLLKAFPNLTLYLVDPRQNQPDGAENYTAWDWVNINREYKANIAPYEGRYVEYNTYSRAASNCILDLSLDFVFIDAQHDYESVKNDITCWLPKIKTGGFISGHDYDDNPERGYGVIQAVDEVFGKSVITGDNFTWMTKI